MGDWSIQQLVFAACVGTFSLIAACCDFRTHRIPNWLTVPMFLAGWAYQAVFAGWAGVADAGMAFGMGFGILFVLWLMGSGGGGDVKLVAAISIWLGLRMTILVMVVSSLLVLVGTLLLVMAAVAGRAIGRDSAGLTNSPPADGETRPRRRVMAYAIPVAFATWAVMVFELRPM